MPRFPRLGPRAALVGAAGLLAAAVPAAADVHCVKVGGGDGCFATIGQALAAAAAGDVVRVAEGTYTENVLITSNDRRLTPSGRDGRPHHRASRRWFRSWSRSGSRPISVATRP
jgi:hypothetical protein